MFAGIARTLSGIRLNIYIFTYIFQAERLLQANYTGRVVLYYNSND